MLWLSSYFFWSYFPVFGIIFIFQAFVFWGFIPYCKIIPFYLNKVVRLTPMHIIIIIKINSSVNPFACKAGPLVLAWSLAFLQSGDSEMRRWFKVSFMMVEIIREVRCSPHYDPLVWSKSRGLLGMIYRVISQFSLAIFVSKMDLDGVV